MRDRDRTDEEKGQKEKRAIEFSSYKLDKMVPKVPSARIPYNTLYFTR